MVVHSAAPVGAAQTTAPEAAPARTALQRSLADHDSPLIYNQWYVAGLTGDFGRDLVEKTLLERSIVFWRTEGGALRAFQNRCAHRAFPLAKSWLEGDAIRCRYHGAKYDADGNMIEVPCQTHCPKVRLKVYPVVEQGPLVWIWMGDEEKITPVPETPFLSEGWAYSFGYHHMQANYVLMTENLLDLSHLPFLHRETFNYPPSYAAVPVMVETDGFRIKYWRQDAKSSHLSMFMPPALNAKIAALDYHVESHSMFVHQGFVHSVGNLTVANPAPGDQALYRARIVHLMTPETRRSTHYWFCHARDFAVDDHAYTETVKAKVYAAFMEDMDAVRMVQELHDTDRHPYREVHFAGDKPTVTMRRLLRKMIDLEYPPEAAPPHAD